MNLAEKHGKKLWEIIKGFEQEDEIARAYQLRLAKLGEYYFRGHQNVYWEASAQDYRDFLESPDANDDDAYYTKVINIYRAHGEAIIAAMTIDIPTVIFTPDNAENADDIRTAQNYTNASLLIQKHNQAPMMFAKAVYLLWTQGFLAGYNYLHESYEYGSVDRDKWGEREIEYEQHSCPECGYLLDESQIQNTSFQANQLNPETQEVEVRNQIGTRCPECKRMIDPQTEVIKQNVPDVIGTTKEMKTRECMEVYGVSHVKVAPYATSQATTPYLVLEMEQHLSQIRYEHEFEAAPYGDSDSGDEKNARQPQMLEEVEGHLATVKRVWLRKSALFYNSTEEGKELLEDFPDGAYAIFVNGDCLKARNESMDDHWTLFEHPTSSHIHPDPMGKPLVDIQDIENEITNLTLQTMEQGISQTFVQQDVLDFDKYRNTESKPGQLYPVSLAPGRSVAEMFYSTKTAIMSQEIDKFAQRNEQKGQLVVGAFPSIYGGTLQGGSKTYAEYAASRQQALQRLMTPYKALAAWWAKMLGRAVPEMVKGLVEDEYFSVKDNQLTLNKVVRSDAENGRIGSVEPDPNQGFPLTWQQKRDTLTELIKMNIPEINEAILTPENATFIAQLIGLPELNLPGQKSRLKQYMEIQLLMQSGPQSMDPPQSSVPIDPELDDHVTEGRVCRDFLQSTAGQDLKAENPQGYANVLAHLKSHLAAMQMQTATEGGGTPPGTAPESASPSTVA